MKVIQYMIIGVAVFLAGCGPSELDQAKQNVDQDLQRVESAMSTLNGQLERGTLRNALLLPTYADKARQKKPEFKKIIDVLESEGSKSGPTYKQIVKRIDDVKSSLPLKSTSDSVLVLEELTNIRIAISNYDAMLIDALNVLSGFSDGELPKIRELEFADASQQSSDVGSEYIGNSNYGRWSNHSNGSSFWEWYGQYAFFSSMFRGPVYYDTWSTTRRPSYYHDRSQGVYGTQTSRKNNSEALSRTKKKYSSQGKSFKSPYAKTTNVKGVSNSTMKSSSRPKFKSSYAKSSNSSSYSKSSNSSSKKTNYNSRSSSGSRSSFGGK